MPDAATAIGRLLWELDDSTRAGLRAGLADHRDAFFRGVGEALGAPGPTLCQLHLLAVLSDARRDGRLAAVVDSLPETGLWGHVRVEVKRFAADDELLIAADS